MGKFVLVVAFAIAFGLSTASAEEGEAPARVPTMTLFTTIQVDGQQSIKSATALNVNGQPIILPPSLWKCYARTAAVTPSPGGAVWLKEVACLIESEKKGGAPLAQIGTLVACSDSSPADESMFYIREQARVLRFTLRCDMPAAPSRRIVTQ